MSKRSFSESTGRGKSPSLFLSLIRRIHDDQSGSISVVTVFAFIFLTMVLGMLMNVGRHADRKVKIQNAADAATMSGSTVLRHIRFNGLSPRSAGSQFRIVDSRDSGKME